MAVDFKDLGLRHVVTPVRLRRSARPVQTPSVLAPTRTVDTPAAPPAPAPVVDLTTRAVSQPRTTSTVADMPGTSYWVRRRRAEALAAEQD